MNYMADLIRDCSKARPNTFNEISFPTFQDIEAKIRNKNLNLRKKAKSRLLERQKLSKTEQVKQDVLPQTKKQTLVYNKIQRQPFNYMQLYIDSKAQKEHLITEFPLQLDKLDEKDQEMTFQIYLMLKKKKTIFKVQEVRRKLKSKEGNRRMNLKECDCCGVLGKHKCKHDICQKKCQKYNKKLQKADLFQENQEPFQMVALAEQMTQGKNLEGQQIPQIVIKVKEQVEQMAIPQIDKIQEKIQKNQREENLQQEAELPAVRETERISYNESNSLISQNLENKLQPVEQIDLSNQKEKQAELNISQKPIETNQAMSAKKQK